MRINRLLLSLAPSLLGACAESAGDNGANASPSNVEAGSSATTDGQGGALGGPPASGGNGAAVPPPGTLPGPVTGSPSPGTTPPSVPGDTSGQPSAPATGGPPTPPGGGGATPSGGAASGGSSGSTPSGGTPSGGSSASGAGGSVSGGATTGGSAGAGEQPVVPMTCPYTPPEDLDTYPEGWTSGEITVFNDNGGWTWYNDERVVVDAEGGKIIVSSAASSASSETSNTNIDAVIHDLATGMNEKMALGSLSYSDDHNNGGILVKGPGEYFVAWAHHNVDCNSYWRNYGGGSWGEQVTYRWAQGCPWGTRPDNITYNNPWEMSSEGRYYNFVRSVETSPNMLISDDGGETWEYGGRLTSSPQQGYNAGYYKYWGNGVDRIDFFATEAHPRDADTSVFHGYITGGKSYDSTGQELDDNIFDGNAPGITEFTRVFSAGSMLNGVALNALWNFDIARYEDGTIAVLWQGRVGGRGKDNTNPQHRVAYSRFDGTEWTSTYLVRGGRTLYRDQSDWWEEDYLGGAALNPDDPHIIYVSTPIDPRDDMTDHGNHEIWKGVTCDDGASFTWTPMTMNSPNENLRPVMPKWDAQNSALLWFRGSYQTAQRYDAEVVGILTRQ